MTRKCKCGRPAVIFRKYEGRALCQSHFFRSVEARIKRTIAKARMIRSGDKIGFALSGGKDSGLAAHIVHKVFSSRPDLSFVALSIDEGIAGYRKAALAKAAKLCKELGIAHHIFSFKGEFGKTLDQKVAEVRKKKPVLAEPCTYCGVARRSLLNKAARKLGVTRLCTGHNLDDEVESILMNYIRGDLDRASRMGPITNWSLSKTGGALFVPRIKPLREVPETEVELYIKLKGLPAHPKGCPYRGGFRVEIEGLLDRLKKVHPGIQFSILHTFDRILPAIRKVIKRGEGEIIKCKKCGEPGSAQICKACELWRSI